MALLVLLISLVFATEHSTESNEEISEQNAHAPILVKIEEDEFAKVKKTSKYIGVTYNETHERWQAQRRSKNAKKMLYNGGYKDEETAARASDTLARKLMENGERNHKINFPDDDTGVRPKEKTNASTYIGVTYSETRERWVAYRRSKHEKKTFYNGSYKDEETAAHASDNLARKFMANGEQNHNLNFPDNYTEVHPEKKTNISKYIGVIYKENRKKIWQAYRRSKNENKLVYNGYYTDEETAAHASDTLARKFMANGEQNLKLNFPDDKIEVNKKVRKNKRKRSEDVNVSHSESNFEKFE